MDEVVTNLVPMLGLHQVIQVRVDHIVARKPPAHDFEAAYAEVIRVMADLVVFQEDVALNEAI